MTMVPVHISIQQTHNFLAQFQQCPNKHLGVPASTEHDQRSII